MKFFSKGLIVTIVLSLMVCGCKTFNLVSDPVAGSVAKPNATEEAESIIASKHVQKQMLDEASFSLPRGMSSISVFLIPVEEDLTTTLKKFERAQARNYFEGYSYIRRITGVEDIGGVRVIGLVYSINSNSRPATLVVFPGTGKALGLLTSGTSADLTKVPAIVAAKTFTGKK